MGDPTPVTLSVDLGVDGVVHGTSLVSIRGGDNSLERATGDLTLGFRKIRNSFCACAECRLISPRKEAFVRYV